MCVGSALHQSTVPEVGCTGVSFYKVTSGLNVLWNSIKQTLLLSHYGRSDAKWKGGPDFKFHV